MKVAKSSNDVVSRADGRLLKESGTSPTKGSILQKSGNPGNDCVRENILCSGSVDIFAGSAAPAVGRSPQVGPDPVDPIEATTPRVVASAKGVATPSPRRGNKDKSSQSQKICPSPDVPMRDNVSQRDDEAARPRVTSSIWDRRPNSSTADENIPNAGGPLHKGARSGRGTIARRDQSVKARGASTIVTQTENAMTDLTRAETLAPKPLRRDIAQKLS